MKARKSSSIKTAIGEVSQSARKRAFRLKFPVAISENGQTILIYPDGTRKPFTPKAIADLKNASKA
jgi:hypothetical protein